MARISYTDATTNPELNELIARISRERGGRLLNLYRALLNSPKIAEAWLQLFTVIRQQCDLPALYRELAILSVALTNRADYEYRSHVPFALKAGLKQAQLDALPQWRTTSAFDEVQRAVLEYAEAMTKDVRVPDDVFQPVARHFAPRQLLELTVTIAGYNMVSRVLEALRIDHD